MTTPDKGYLGNASLKGRGVQIEYSNEMVLEYARCASDPVYFCEKYVKIIHVDHGLIPLKLYDYQKEIIEAITHNRRVVVNTSRQAGKALSLDTPIPTPIGWKTMGDIQVGDIIFDANGKETRVSFTTDVMHDHDVYDIHFDNGEIVKADAEHLWTFSTNVYNSGKMSTENTEKLLEILKKAKKMGQGVKIKCTEPVNYKFSEQKIPPYILGLWLGDGNSCDGRITCDISDYNSYKEKIVSLGFKTSEFKIDKRSDRTGNFTIYGLFPLLKHYNLLKNKHIPKNYEFASKEQRQELIKGLMDSDGYCGKRGACEFYQKKEEIIESFKRILSSMGVKVKKKSREISGDKYYTLCFSTKKFDLFHLDKKLERQKKCQGSVVLDHFYIKDIVKCESVPVKCIQVENDEHLFLCSNSYIPTHNTTTAVAIILHYVLFNTEPKLVALLANKGDAAREILERIQTAYEALPKWLQQGVVEWNKGSVKFENGCKIIAASTSSSSIRGKSAAFLYIDETAFVENWDEFFASTFPTISSGKQTKMLFTSTPNGLNHFYKTCEGAKEVEPGQRAGKNGYIYIEVKWDRVPGRDEEWRRDVMEALDHDAQKFAQEFECVAGETIVEVRSKETGIIRKIQIKELYAEVYEETQQAIRRILKKKGKGAKNHDEI